MWDWCHHSYTRVASEKQSLFSRVASTTVQRYFENQAMRLETLSDHWLTGAWSQKERHVATESDIVRHLLLKRTAVPSLGGVRGKHQCTNHQGDTCVVHLIGSLVRQTLHFIDGIQLTGSPIRWDDAGLNC